MDAAVKVFLRKLPLLSSVKVAITLAALIIFGPQGALITTLIDPIILFRGVPQTGLSMLSGNKIVVIAVAIATTFGIVNKDKIWEIVKELAIKVKSGILKSRRLLPNEGIAYRHSVE